MPTEREICQASRSAAQLSEDRPVHVPGEIALRLHLFYSLTILYSISSKIYDESLSPYSSFFVRNSKTKEADVLIRVTVPLKHAQTLSGNTAHPHSD